MVEVSLHLYDLSQGMASSLSGSLLGKQIDGIWHTGIVVFGREFYFGGGICADLPGQTPYGAPIKSYALGTTRKSSAEFDEFLRSVSSRFSLMTYDLFSNNCNNFSDACAEFLTDSHIPQFILDLPNEALDSPMGPMLRAMMENVQSVIRDQSAGHEINLQQAHNSGASSNQVSADYVLQGKFDGGRTRDFWNVPATHSRANRAAITQKLSEFASDFNEHDSVDALFKLARTLPEEKSFPVFDLLRLAALESEESCDKVADEILQILPRYTEGNTSTFRGTFMMVLRCVANCFKFTSATQRLLRTHDTTLSVINATVAGLAHSHSAVSKTAAMVALNIAGAPNRSSTVLPLLDDHAFLLVNVLCEQLTQDAEMRQPEEALYLLKALAVMVDSDQDALQLAKAMDLSIARYTDESLCSDEHVRQVAKKVETLLDQ